MAVTEQSTGKIGEEEKESLYFKDPFTDMAFLHTLALHGFKGSEIGECYSAAAQIRGGRRRELERGLECPRGKS